MLPNHLFNPNQLLFSIITASLFINVVLSRNSDYFNGSKKFNESLSASSEQYVRISSVADYFREIFNILINLQLDNPFNFEINESSQTLITNYMQEFSLIRFMISNKLNRDLNNLINSLNDASILKFKNYVDCIQNSIISPFSRLFTNDPFNPENIELFLSETIYDTNFQNNFRELYFRNSETNYKNSTRSIVNIVPRYLLIIDFQVDYSKYCGKGSIANLMFNLYKKTSIDIIKAFGLMIIGYNFIQSKNLNYNFYRDQQVFLLDKYKKSIKKLIFSLNGVNSYLNKHHRIFRNCDPPEWTEGENYIRVKNYVSNQRGYRDYSNRDARLKKDIDEEFECDYYTLYTNPDYESVDSLRCPEIFEIAPQYKNAACSEKIQDYFISGDSASYSNWNVSCYEEELNDHLYESLCFCDKQYDVELSVRHFCMDEHNTDSANRLVVTGIRFVMKVKTITIEIQEGKLVNGTVDPKTVRWITETSDSSGKCLKTIKLGFRFKSFNMDDIMLPDGYFVTGVRFELLNDNHITLVVRGTKMWNDENFWPSSTHMWFYPEIARNYPREQIVIKDYRHPAESITQNEKISHSGFNYVDLSVGIISNKHNNLPVIPFFDSQNVEFYPPSPIGGLGVFYKGTSGYGGFIAFQLIASRYTFNTESENLHFDLE